MRPNQTQGRTEGGEATFFFFHKLLRTKKWSNRFLRQVAMQSWLHAALTHSTAADKYALSRGGAGCETEPTHGRTKGGEEAVPAVSKCGIGPFCDD